jgi:hypothetical protein
MVTVGYKLFCTLQIFRVCFIVGDEAQCNNSLQVVRACSRRHLQTL